MLCWPRARRHDRPAHLMKLRYLLLALPLALILAACGGGSAALSSGDVAVVGNEHVTKAQFDEAMNQQRLGLKRQKQKFPTAGDLGAAGSSPRRTAPS